LNDSTLRDCRFCDLQDFLSPGDCLVLNDTAVIPARLVENGIEVFLLRRIEENIWHALVKPGKKMREGDVAAFGGGAIRAKVSRVLEDGVREIVFSDDFDSLLEKHGTTPLPPYIKEQANSTRYQTVYAKHKGAVAAPTAGLHFTKAHLSNLRDFGVNIAYITLHVGLGTFRPVTDENIENHHMHSEFYSIDEKNAALINQVRQNNRKIIAVGTTCVRTLESAARNGIVVPQSGETEIFIRPGYEFKIVDALLTNFHLPKSTLIMLVAAFAGLENTKAAYAHAIEQEYRFFSFGDAMFIY
jgi:S-adenosylmethionine:tRNA ribosyltransferase-isomerase